MPGLTRLAEVDARIAAAERDLAALDGPSDAQAKRDALVEFDALWNSRDGHGRARVRALVLEGVVADGTMGETKLRLRGGL